MKQQTDLEMNRKSKQMESRLFHIFCASFSCCFSDYFFVVVVSNYTREVLLIMAYTTAGKLRPKGVSFQASGI